MLRRHGDLVLFETHDPEHDDGWEYQFAILRSPGVEPRRRSLDGDFDTAR